MGLVAVALSDLESRPIHLLVVFQLGERPPSTGERFLRLSVGVGNERYVVRSNLIRSG
jgi:hypothetical protein